MRTFAEKPKATEQTTSAKPTISGWAHFGQNCDVNSILHLQRTVGNHAVKRLLQVYAQELENESRTSALPRFAHDFSRIPVHAGVHTTIQQSLQVNSVVQPGRLACVAIPVATVTAMEDQDKTGSGAFEGEPITMQPEGPDQTPAPLNEDGLIDGEWTSEIAVNAFVNGGKTGTAIVHWAGGTGGTGGNAGVVGTVAPVIDTSGPAAAGGTAQAWVQAGTGTATVRRSYIGVLTGANGANYYITARAAARIDRHEAGHIAHTKTHHDTHITPLENRIAQHTGQAKALNQGANAAAAKTALETFLNWNGSITSFRNADIADNGAGGTFDTTELASPDFIRDYGARAVGGVNYAHYIDTPPGP
jgi:hypothetical protein